MMVGLHNQRTRYISRPYNSVQGVEIAYMLPADHISDELFFWSGLEGFLRLCVKDFQTAWCDTSTGTPGENLVYGTGASPEYFPS